MLLFINDNRTVEDLQDHFNECFPYLKLEFYKEADGNIKARDKSNIVRPNTAISAIRNKSFSGFLDIKSWYKTSKVKHDFKNIFGLNVQILRRHGHEWIPTSYSDELSLQQQSELARQDSLLQLQ